MLSEQIGNILSIILTLTGLTISLFHYVSKPCRAWIYCMGFLMGHLLSNYYWGAYAFLMGDYPDITSFMAYLGWDICYVFLVILLIEIRFEGEKGFFSPISLLPIPIIIPQVILYCQFGGILNNIWQNFWCALAACLSVNSLVYYIKNKKKGANKPHVAIMVLHFLVLEYVMWTSSCFDWPGEWLNPYPYASYCLTVTFVLISWAIAKDMNKRWRREKGTPVRKSQAVLRPLYILTIGVFCFGGFIFANWMKNEMIARVGEEESVSLFPMIAIVLFAISVIIIIFTIAIIFIFTYGQRAAESKMLRIEKTHAEQANAAKSDFLANMSHEIRTPINAVLGMNEMILRESVQAKEIPPEDTVAMHRALSNISTYSGNIDSAGNNLLSIINDILDFSKIEAGKLEIVKDNYKLSSVLNAVCIMVGIRAKEKRLSFDTAIDGSLPENLFGDAVRVQQVITNVLNNAVKYTNEGSVRLSVYKKEDAEVAPGKDLSIIFEVKDTGIGIRKEDIERMFDKFERVDLRQNSTIEGTGLGLAITHNLLDMMGGSISVESDYGKGSVFTVVIPQQVVSAEPMGDFRNKAKTDLKTTPSFKESFKAPDAVILVVDDTAMNLKVVEGLLKKTEIEMDMASSGAQAIEMAARRDYDVILMDQRMPIMDGTEAMNKIKEAGGANAGVPFICLTADAVTGAKEKYLTQGFTDYLTKPINRIELEEMLVKYLP